MVMFDTDSYSVGEDDGSLLYGLTATGIASFDYEVVITTADGSTVCEYTHCVSLRLYILLWAALHTKHMV